jgi:hypothetical protein
MAAKDVLGAGDAAKGIGTKVSEYSEGGPFHCGNCVFAIRKDVPKEGQGLCNEPHVLKDPQVPTARRSKLKVVDLKNGCCRFVRPPE